MIPRDLSPIERDEDFVEFPVDRCVTCGAVIGKDEARDDVCDACSPAPVEMCETADETLDNQRVA